MDVVFGCLEQKRMAKTEVTNTSKDAAEIHQNGAMRFFLSNFAAIPSQAPGGNSGWKPSKDRFSSWSIFIFSLFSLIFLYPVDLSA
jgi:hypothetical protein